MNPNLGETIDRLTILERKIVEGRRQGRLVRRFADESAQLYAHVHKLGAPVGFLQQYLQLAALNAAIWDATDKMKKAIDDDAASWMVTWGAAIFNWNNERAAIVAELGSASGEADPEKLYDLGRG